VLLALTRIIPIKPFSIPAGHPGATESPADAPGRVTVDSAHAPAAMLVKSITAETVMYVGTVAESTATTVCVPVSRATIPVPLPRLRVLRNALLSLPPLMSQSPFVAVHVNSGIDPAGNVVTALTAPHTPAQVSVRLCPATNAPDASTYRYKVPLPADSVIVLLFVTEYTVFPNRVLQGVVLEQFNPAVSTVGLVSTSPRSPSCDAIPAPLAPDEVTPPDPVIVQLPVCALAK
jgi:hypothetical protein